MLYGYIEQNYAQNEPIFISDLVDSGLKIEKVRNEVKGLTDDGKLKRYDTGIYYIPKKTIFNVEATPSRDLIIEKKFLKDGQEIVGYISGILFANQLGLTTQVPTVYEVVSNKATRASRKLSIGNATVLLRKPRVSVTAENYKVLQLLDLIMDIDFASELKGNELKEKLLAFMKKAKITVSMLREYTAYYPDKIYKNMYGAGVLDYVSAQ